MTNVTIFKNKDAVVSTGRRELSDLAKSLSGGGATSRRIQTNTNGTFKRIINGEQVGNAVRGELNVIILHALPKVSRIFYKEKFDPNKEATLPDCWSNLGDKPEAAAANPQSSNCATCAMNVKGSGDNGGRACRFQRRISVLLADDPSGDVYQFNVPAKSLFGTGVGNAHPFEGYVKYLLGHGESPDGVVTNISFDPNADTMQLVFTPLRGTSDEEYELVRAAQQKPETKNYTMITVAQTDGVKKQPAAVTKAVPVYEPTLDEPAEPVKRAAKKQDAAPAPKKDMADIVNAWGEDD